MRILRMFLGFPCRKPLSIALGVLLFPAIPLARGAIAGQVTDTSGAIVPGVTVEATSPALIEGTRSTSTDEQGRYQITGLRPGAYKVTFTLPGFRTIIREGIEL